MAIHSGTHNWINIGHSYPTGSSIVDAGFIEFSPNLCWGNLQTIREEPKMSVRCRYCQQWHSDASLISYCEHCGAPLPFYNLGELFR